MIFLGIELPEALTPNLQLMLPEFIVAGTALGAIIPELVLPAGRRAAATAWTSLIGLVIAFIVLLTMEPTSTQFAIHVKGEAGEMISGWRSDAFSIFSRAVIAGGGALLVLMAMPFTRRMDRGHGEFYALLLFALLGVMLVSGVSDMLSLFVCLELVTIMAYILAAFRRNDLRSTEAGLKYLVIGAVSTAVLLLGIALIYGATGSISFEALAKSVASGPPSAFLVLGIAFVLVGLFFKVGGVPFHVWIPDVYEGAPSPVTAFLITASKAAGVILLLRFGEAAFLPALDNPDSGSWALLLGAVAALTLLFGVLSAIPQRDMKRMLAFSSIGHAGYMIMGIAAMAASGGSGEPFGPSALLFYIMAYFVTSVTAFTVIIAVSAATGTHGAAAWTGLARRSPFLALAMCLALLSLAGVPPMAGFFAKFLILNAVIDKGMIALAVIGAAAVIIGLYFYFLWIKEMYLRAPAPETADEPPIAIHPITRGVLVFGMVAMVGMGIAMGPFYEWAHEAAQSLGLLWR